MVHVRVVVTVGVRFDVGSVLGLWIRGSVKIKLGKGLELVMQIWLGLWYVLGLGLVW